VTRGFGRIAAMVFPISGGVNSAISKLGGIVGATTVQEQIGAI